MHSTPHEFLRISSLHTKRVSMEPTFSAHGLKSGMASADSRVADLIPGSDFVQK
jgi:hypothetical protein